MTQSWNTVEQVTALINKALPLVYDDSLSYYEQLSKFQNALNLMVQNNNGMPDYLKALILEFINGGELGEIISQIMANFILNVKYPPAPMIGAVGDGTKDDTAAIQACIDYAETKGGMCIYFPNGVYLVNSLELKDNISITGASRYNTRLVLKGGATKPLIYGECSNNEITNIYLDGNADVQVNNLISLNLTGSNWLIANLILNDGHELIDLTTTAGNVTLENIHCKRATLKSIKLTGTANVIVNDIYCDELSAIYGECAIDTALNDAIFTNIVSNVIAPYALKVSGNNNNINMYCKNSVADFSDTGTANNIYILNKSNKRILTGELKNVVAKNTLTVSGDSTTTADTIHETSTTSKTVNGKDIEETYTGNREITANNNTENYGGNYSMTSNNIILTPTLIKHITTDYIIDSVNPLTYKEPTILTEQFNSIPFKTADNEVYNVLVKGGKINSSFYYNVIDFGAKIDGITDDSTAIQAAIDYANTNGGVVFFPPGNYIVAHSIILKTGVTLLGAGENVTILNSTIIGDSLFKITDLSAAFIRISDMQLKGNAVVGVSGNGHAINFIDPAIDSGTHTPQHCFIERVYIKDFLGFDKVDNTTKLIESCAVIQQDGLQVIYRDLTIANCGHGFYIQLAQNTKIENCSVDGAMKYAAYVYDTESVIIDKCDFINSGDGITSTGYPITTSMSGIVFSSMNQGFIIRNSKMKNTGGKALIVSMFSESDIIDSNWLRATMTADIPHKAIYAERCQAIKITNNLFSAANSAYTTQKFEQIELYNTTTNEGFIATIENNTFGEASIIDTSYNIKINGNATARTFPCVSIQNNKFGYRDNASAAIVIDADIIITNCTFTKSIIKNNLFYAGPNITRTVCVSVSTATLSDNTIGQNMFEMNTGVITTQYSGITENVLTATATWNPGSLVDGAGETSAAITVTGAALGDFVSVSAPYDLQGITCNGYVSATDTVNIRIQNETGNTIDLASGGWKVRVTKAV